MSNHESSLLKLWLLLYSTLIAEMDFIIFSCILIGLNFAPPAQLMVVGKAVSAERNGNLMLSRCVSRRGRWTVLQL